VAFSFFACVLGLGLGDFDLDLLGLGLGDFDLDLLLGEYVCAFKCRDRMSSCRDSLVACACDLGRGDFLFVKCRV